MMLFKSLCPHLDPLPQGEEITASVFSHVKQRVGGAALIGRKGKERTFLSHWERVRVRGWRGIRNLLGLYAKNQHQPSVYCGADCEVDSSPDSSFVGSIVSVIASSISFVWKRASQLNWTAAVTIWDRLEDAIRLARASFAPHGFVNFDFGTTRSCKIPEVCSKSSCLSWSAPSSRILIPPHLNPLPQGEERDCVARVSRLGCVAVLSKRFRERALANFSFELAADFLSFEKKTMVRGT